VIDMAVNSYDITIRKHGRLLVSIKDFLFEENKITFLFGESGIGKSLISKTIYGIIDPEELEIRINNEAYDKYYNSSYAREIRRNSFFVSQEPSSHLNPLMTLEAQIQESNLSNLKIEAVLRKLWNTTDNNTLRKILSIYPKPYRPSGGEKQRLLLTMAFSKLEILKKSSNKNERTLFVFDEPSGSLDNYFRNIFLSYLIETFKQKLFTALVITHDYSMINAIKNAGERILKEVVFKELVLSRKGLVLNEYTPELYTDWLKQQEKRINTKENDTVNKKLLSVESGIEVFGKKLVLYRDPDNQNQCALEINPYSIVYLKAPSGTGKTTLAKSIMGLIQTKRLQIKLKNILLTEKTSKNIWQKHIWGKQITITFQHADEALNQDSTVKGIFSGLPQRISPDNIKKSVEELFDIEIDERFLNKKVKYLSGGQKQKLNLLRSFVLDTDILILDEPLNGLDFTSIVKVLSMIENKRKAGKGILLISHNEEIFDTVVNPENVYYLNSE